MPMNNSEIILYTTPAGTVKLEVILHDETVWLTHLFERLAIQMLKSSANRNQTAKVLRVSWGQLNRIMSQAVARGFSRRKNEIIPSIGMDEKSFLSGLTVMTDIQGKRVIEIAKMLKRHIEGLLTWIKHHITNGLTEGLNSKIQQIKSVARGFRDFNNYQIAILFHLGGLDMIPH